MSGVGARRRIGAVLIAGLAVAGTGCRKESGTMSRQAHGDSDTRPYLLETIGEFAIARAYGDGFEDLTPRQRVLAYYLSRAAIAGRDIYYDQMGRDNLEVRDLLEEILIHPREVVPEVREAILRYLKLFWINNGNHNERTRRKFVPEFTVAGLQGAAAAAAREGATFKLALGETLAAKIDRLRPVIFDPEFEPLSTCKTPPPGRDLLTCSSVNFYDGLTLAEVEAFRESYPLNSRLTRRDGRPVEEVYRAGRAAREGSPAVPAGRYALQLQTVIGFLEKARAHAEPGQSAVLAELIEYFATGDPEAFRRYNIAWVKDEGPVDTINGFIETYKDPRGQKGSYEGLVHFVNRPMNRMQKAIADLAQHFEDRAPWDDRYKRRGFNIPVANAVNMIAAIGDGGPMPAIGVNLPNEEAIRERHGNKSVSFINIMDASHRSTHDATVEEFFLPEDRPLQREHGSTIGLVMTALHEILGHASGKASETLGVDPRDRLREYYSALEEARAELVALHTLFDPALRAAGVVASEAVAEAGYRDYATHDLYMLRQLRDGDQIEDDHMRATHLIVGYLKDVTGAVEQVRRDDRAYMRVKDLAAMRRGVATLLAEVQRIKSEGDFPAARDLIERHAVRFDPALRDEVVARAVKAGIPSYTAFVMPDIVPVRDADGVVVDARLEATSDFTLQMLKYSGKHPLEPAAR